MNLFKKIFFPERGKKELLAYESWVVEWVSRQGQFSRDTRKEFEVFTSEEDAKYFKKQLEEAFKLIRHTSQVEVVITKN